MSWMPAVAAIVFLYAIARESAPSGPAPSPGPTPRPNPGPVPGPTPKPEPTPNPGPVPGPTPGRVLLVGDEHALFLAPPLAAQLGLVVTPAGVPGTTLDFWAGAAGGAAKAVVPGQPTLVLVSLGHHDGERAPVAPVSEQVASIVRVLRRAGPSVSVAWVLPPRVPDPWAARFAIRDALVNEHVPTFDGVIVDHPTPEITPDIYPEWAATLALWLRNNKLVPGAA